jgi:hypothetical protein
LVAPVVKRKGYKMNNEDIDYREGFFEDLSLELGSNGMEAYFYHDEDGKITFDIRDEGSFTLDEEDWVLGKLPLSATLDVANLKREIDEALKENN